MKATKKATKELVLIARYTFKHNGAVVYRVRSNQPNKKGRVEGVDQVEFKGEWYDAHNVTCVEGEVRGCTCKGSEYRRKCFHRDGIQIRLETPEQKEAREWAQFRSELAVKLSKQYMTTQCVEQIAESLVETVAQPVVPPIAMDLPAELRGRGKKLVAQDLSTKGSLNGAQQSAGLLMALPSRKARAS